MMKIPFFSLSRQYDQIREEVETSVRDVMRSNAYIEGQAVKSLEKELSEYLNVRHVVTCGNGTDALRIALQAIGVTNGDEVITTPFTFFATAEAISQTGATPVFVDICEDSLNIDPKLIREKITSKTKAILPVHIFGLPADMDEINTIASEYGISVIEDACQAIGSEYKDKKTGTLGNLGCFSFYPTKNLGAFGDGGMITTDDDELALVCRAIKSHAAGRMGAEAYQIMTGEIVDELSSLNQSGDSLYDPCKYFNYFIGSNSRLDSIQAAILSIKLKHLDEYNSKRRNIAMRYTSAFAKTPIIPPYTDYSDRVHCFHQYPVLCDDKDGLMKYMNEKGIGTGAFYPIPLHLQRSYSKLNYKPGDLPVAESVCKRSVCLPVFPELYDEEIEYVIDTIEKWIEC